MANLIKKSILILSLLSLVFFSACSTTSDINENRDTLSREQASESFEENQLEKVSLSIGDGEYEEFTSYTTPGGEEEIKMVFEIQDNKIMSLEVLKSEDAKQISQTRIDSFNSNVDSIIGKTLDEIQELGVIGGSSLTTKAVKLKLEELAN